MKNFILLLLTASIISCNEKRDESESNSKDRKGIDIQAELESIEEIRAGFELAIKEKRYADLKNYATANLISLTLFVENGKNIKDLEITRLVYSATIV